MHVYGTDRLSGDTDRDNLSDGEEIKKYKSDPLSQDTDADGLADGVEVLKYGTKPNRKDTDGDGLSDPVEIREHGTDPLRKDSDSDGWHDGKELEVGTDPLKSDTDGDGIDDSKEGVAREGESKKYQVDSRVVTERQRKIFCDDGNDDDPFGMSLTNDCWEDVHTTEYRYGYYKWSTGATDPLKRDTDSDGKHDGVDLGQICFYESGWPGFLGNYSYSQKNCINDRPGVETELRRVHGAQETWLDLLFRELYR